MDPTSAAGVGEVAAGLRLSAYFTTQLVSVLLPGVVTVATSGLLISHAQYGEDTWEQLVQISDDVHGPLAVLLAVLLIAASYVVGYVTRHLGFYVLGLAERVSRHPALTAAQLHRQLRDRYGDRVVDNCFAAHPLLERFLSDEQDAGRDGLDGLGGALSPGNSLEAFVYAKHWLMEVVPSLAPTDAEREINILVSTLFPVGLGTWLFILLSGAEPFGAVASALVGLALCWLVLSSSMRLRRSERWESLRGVVEGHEMRLALARQHPPPAVPLPGPQPMPAPRPSGNTQGA